MRVKLLVDERSVRRWHVALLRRLSALPNFTATIEALPAPAKPARRAELLFWLDGVVGGHKPGLSARAAPAELEGYRHRGEDSADLTLDLFGAPRAGRERVWQLSFGGEPGEHGLLAALFARRTPLATVSENGAVIASGRLGTEHGGNVLGSLEDFLARTITLILAALVPAASTVPALPAGAASPAAVRSRPSLAVVGAKQLIRAGVRELYRLCYKTPHWRVGWRRLDGPDLMTLGSHPETGWRSMADDGHRFYADPFPIEHDGQVTLFVEEFSHRLGKAIISAVAFGPDGPLGVPEPVLDLPHHLSYPFVFEEEGEFWMIPESCSAGTIDLFRATRFPGGWVKEATLVADTVASDPTLLRHHGLWWLFATVRDGGGAYSDALSLWWADDFRGPWIAHQANPVLIDIASARPAGRIVERNGELWRPVQDCRRGYGAALGLARIRRLDKAGFEQTIEAILSPGPSWPGRRLHTLNRAGNFEFIDGSASVRRWL